MAFDALRWNAVRRTYYVIVNRPPGDDQIYVSGSGTHDGWRVLSRVIVSDEYARREYRRTREIEIYQLLLWREGFAGPWDLEERLNAGDVNFDESPEMGVW